MTSILVTTAGGAESNSYISLSEAEDLLTASGMKTDRWIALDERSAKRITTEQTGPYSFTASVNDKVKLAVGSGSDQTITLSGSHLNALSVCNQLNDQSTGISCRPTIDNKIEFYVDSHSSSLIIKSVTGDAYGILGISAGTYTGTSITAFKEYLLILATTLIGQLPLRGRRTTITQALDFPRWMQDYTESLPVGELPDEATEVPDGVKMAQALMACLVVEPNIDYQNMMAASMDSPAWLQNSIVKQVQVAGIMTVKLGTATSTGGNTPISSNKPTSLVNIYGLPIYIAMKPYLTQIRGGSLRPTSEDYYRRVNNLPDYDSRSYTPLGWVQG